MSSDETTNLFHYAFENKIFKDVVSFSREHLSHIALFDIEPMEGDRLHRIGMDIRLLPDANVARMWCSPGTATRTPSHIADGNDNLVLVMPTTSPELISRKGHKDVTCHPGEVYLWAGDEPLSFAYHADCTVLCVSLPRAAVNALNPSLEVMTRLDPAQAPDLWLLRHYATLLLENQPLTAQAEQLVSSHLHDLAALLLKPRRQRPEAAQLSGVRAARLAAVKADIARHWQTSGFSMDTVAARQGLTPQYIRALFHSVGTTFSDYVRDLRLDRVAQALGDPALAGQKISALAFAAGFNDLSYFNRIFRQRFGITPSDFRARSRASSPNFY